MNKDFIINYLKELGFELGCYDNDMEKLTKKQLKTLMEAVKYGSCDIDVLIKRKKYVIEAMYVDNEVDFYVLTNKEYQERYED